MRAQRHTLANALRVAADQYAADATIFANLATAEAARTDLGESTAAALATGHGRTATTFAAQAVAARRLAEEIEQADSIQLDD